MEAEAEKDEWIQLGVVTTGRAKRMKDSQFISELLLILLEEKLIGFDQDYLDDSYAKYDNPEKTQFNFSEEEFIRKLEQVKGYISDVQKANKSVTSYAKTFANFYSLWSLIALQYKDLPLPEKFASAYQDFMKKVNQLANSNNPDYLIKDGK